MNEASLEALRRAVEDLRATSLLLEHARAQLLQATERFRRASQGLVAGGKVGAA